MLTPHSKESVIPQEIQGSPNRLLTPQDLEVIFKGAGSWRLYYSLLLATGLSCVAVAQLASWNVDHANQAIKIPEGRSGRFSVFLLGLEVMNQIPKDRMPSEPLFPTLHVDLEDESFFEEQMDENLAMPLDYLQALLGAADRPIASLFSFTMTHRHLVQNLDSPDPNWQALLEKSNDVLRYPGEPMVLN